MFVGVFVCLCVGGLLPR